jgi:N-acetyl-1-D-myo-inositol-2-amino-2-deoxy-alpha-D-glucopyranoside deacetylase
MARQDRGQGLAGASLLAVFAHPDDESLACGGLLARCAAEGARVSLLCLTRGEHGPGSDAPSAAASLGETRAHELREAARMLGVHDVELLAHEDGMLPWIDPSVLEGDIGSAIRRTAPDVVVTFDEDGLYGHPDHVAVHDRSTAAVAALRGAAPALRYVSMPHGAMRGLVDACTRVANDDGGGRAPVPVLGGLDPDAFGAMAPPVTLVVDVGAYAARKLDALRCHRSQVGRALDGLDHREAALHLGLEHYRHAAVGSRAPAFMDAWGEPASAAAPR